MTIKAFLDCGCAIMENGSRLWCPGCLEGAPRSVGLTEDERASIERNGPGPQGISCDRCGNATRALSAQNGETLCDGCLAGCDGLEPECEVENCAIHSFGI